MKHRTLLAVLTALVAVAGLASAPRAEADGHDSLQIVDAFVLEGFHDNAVFEVLNSGTLTATITYETVEGSSQRDSGWDGTLVPAEEGEDYTRTTGQLVIEANDVGLITVPVSAEAGDDEDDTVEWFHVEIEPVEQIATVAKDMADALVIDDDAQDVVPPIDPADLIESIPDGIPQISVANGSRAEGDSGQPVMRFKVATTEAMPFPMAFNYATSDDSAEAGEDYVDSSGNVTIEAGKKEAWIEIPLRGDTIHEDSERFDVGINSLAWFTFITDDSATGTIANDDAIPALRVTNVKVEEGERAVFRVLRSNGSEDDVSFSFATKSASADGGKDFASVSGRREFDDPSDLVEQVSVAVRNDSKDEDGERFVLRISGARDARIVDETGAARIVDND